MVNTPWSDEETELLVRLAKKNSFENIVLPGRSKDSIRTKYRRLSYAGRIKHKYKAAPWQRSEIYRLRDLTVVDNLTAKAIFLRKIFPRRTLWAIAKQMSRSDFATPKFSKRAIEAIRLKRDQRPIIREFLLNEGRQMVTPQLTEALQKLLGVPVKSATVRGWRRSLLGSLSWHESHGLCPIN